MSLSYDGNVKINHKTKTMLDNIEEIRQNVKIAQAVKDRDQKELSADIQKLKEKKWEVLLLSSSSF